MRRDDPLAPYHARRDFRHSPEPAGRTAGRRRPARTLQFVVQRHDARRLHYDFRLEWDGTLKSWAVPKGPSLDPQVQRLAVEVEDHPLDYARFEGTIPQGHYGAGDVAIWDRGTWVPEDEDVAAALQRGKLHFELHGERLHGSWVLFRTSGSQWMLRKRRDAHARPGDGDGVLRASAPTASARRPPRAGHGDPLPEWIAPQLATLVERPPQDARWVYEVKYDGYRMLARLDGREVRLYSRNGLDWTARLPRLAQRLSRLRLGPGWLDGEIVVMDTHGRTDFHALQAQLDGPATDVEYVVFDVPWWQGQDLRDAPLSRRLAVLDGIFDALPADAALGRSRPLDPHHVGQAVLDAACRMQLEGLIGKRLDAPYRSGRSPHWIKLKCRAEQEVVIGGYTEPRGSRGHLGALLVGVWGEDGQLDYAGRVGSGFDAATLAALHARLAPDERATCPFRHRPALPGASRVHWVQPHHVAQVRYATWSRDGLLRQASYAGLREDKPAREVVRERARPVQETATMPTAATPARSSHRPRAPRDDDTVMGVRVTHPGRVVYGTPRVTKLEVVRYHEAMAEYLMPHLRKRPLSLLRCPQGAGGECFFQKHIETRLPPGVVGVEVPASDGPDTQVMVSRPEGIVALAQYGTLELHTWGARTPRLEKADRLTMDLDPDPTLPWSQVVEAARLTRVLLEELGLRPFLKTTGGKGLHVVVPLKATRGWDEVKAFARAVATRLASVAPQRFTAQLSKSRRRGRIFVDYLRNGRGATAIAAYSLRARDGAPVAMPLHWDALSPHEDLRGARFNLHNAAAHVADAEAAWADYDASRATLTVKMMKALGVTP
ncbi:DNA ligase D [Caldimonas thermodepolymerans]|uniref:DNA ligase (ATP) n=1 Tax=Caldimonas thermodepolymerans TaxID=215580 RepID=A0AA46DH32_9BURK|nr:DNA ligase D [Caldimonas thermodepolymerans]TCP09839.1 ATP-dependent DNA ligase LigD phosphoesterase module /ATP-dependent DNA ligase LigD polymerase module [Caldimonas thermodepolymerans]UZG49846.1 DNA ligase D [Caldimonas thermodepolymerans]